MFGSSQWMYSSGGGFYDTEIDGSLRFNNDDSAYLSRTPASAGNRRTFTWSGWIKRNTLGTPQTIFLGGRNGTTNGTFESFYFRDDDGIDFGGYQSNYVRIEDSTRAFRDVSAWYHIVLSVDTTQATASDRIKIYVNGENQSFTSTNYPAQNFDTGVNSTDAHHIGGDDPAGGYADYYLAEVNFIDGSALDPTSFGETKSGV